MKSTLYIKEKKKTRWESMKAPYLPRSLWSPRGSMLSRMCSLTHMSMVGVVSSTLTAFAAFMPFSKFIWRQHFPLYLYLSFSVKLEKSWEYHHLPLFVIWFISAWNTAEERANLKSGMIIFSHADVLLVSYICKKGCPFPVCNSG